MKSKLTQCLALVVATAVPSTGWAQAGHEEPRTEQAPRTHERARGEAAPATPEGRSEATAENQVKAQVLPALAGVEAARVSVAALRELAMMQSLDRRDARRTAELANRGIEMAQERIEALGDMRQLSPEARNDVNTAERQLREARASIEQIHRDVGVVEGIVQRDEAQNVRARSEELHTQLAGAQRTIEHLAGQYRISTNLEGSPRGASARG